MKATGPERAPGMHALLRSAANGKFIDNTRLFLMPARSFRCKHTKR